MIRKLNINDNFSDLISLSREFFEEYEKHYNEFFLIDKLKDNHIVDYFTRTIDSDRDITFIAIIEGQIVGYITAHKRFQAEFYKIKSIGTISGLMVNKEYRRKGIASRLLAQLKIYFKKNEIRYFSLFTAVTNEAAIEFYKNNGMNSILTTLLGEID